MTDTWVRGPVAITQRGAAEEIEPARKAVWAGRRRIDRGALPAHLPRVERLVDIDGTACPRCAGALHRVGEDVSERLDVVPAQFRVLVIRRPRYACRACEEVVVQASAPTRLTAGGLPTDALVAQVPVSQYADRLPLYRRAQIFARQRVTLDRSTLADRVGCAAFLSRRVHARLLETLKRSGRLFADETTAPVLDPGRGRTKTGQLWAYARNDRPWGGSESQERAVCRVGRRRAVIASPIETCKLVGVEPQACLAEVITRMVAGHPQRSFDELLSWEYPAIPTLRAVA